MTYILDSDVLIYYFKNKQPFFELVESLLNKFPVVISTVSLAEVRAGWDEKQTQKWLPIITDLFPTVDVTYTIAEQAGYQIKRYSNEGKTLATTDGIIASTALLNSYCLVTNNRKHYPMPELHLYRDLF